MSEPAENPFDRPALAPVPDPFEAERSECRRQTRAALDWLRSPASRGLSHQDAEERLREVLPMAAVPFDAWRHFGQRQQAPAPDGQLTVTCPCPCGHDFDVSLRGEAL